MLVNYWADPRPQDRRSRRHRPVTIPSPFVAANRQFYASVDGDFDSGVADVAPGISVECAVDADHERSAQVRVDPRRAADIERDRAF
jgi:hypothetical protein